MRLVRMRFMSGGSSMPSMTTSSWLSASPPPPPIIPGIIMFWIAPVIFGHDRAGRPAPRGSARIANRRSRHSRGLEHEVAVRRQRALRAVEERRRGSSAVASGWKPEPSDWRRMPTASISSMKTMHWPPHLAASFFALRAR